MVARGLPQKRCRQYVGIVITAFQANKAAMPINMTQSSGRRSRSGIFVFFLPRRRRVCCSVFVRRSAGAQAPLCGAGCTAGFSVAEL